jgi:hypothetical protein
MDGRRGTLICIRTQNFSSNETALDIAPLAGQCASALNNAAGVASGARRGLLPQEDLNTAVSRAQRLLQALRGELAETIFCLLNEPEEAAFSTTGRRNLTEIYDWYFGILRGCDLSMRETLAGGLDCIRLAVPDLRNVEFSQFAAELFGFSSRFITDAIGEGRGFRTEASVAKGAHCDRPWSSASGETPAISLGALARWRLGHQLFALANRSAANWILRAVENLTSVGAAQCLSRALADFRSAATAMQYAAAMSPEDYSMRVRPTMARPSFPIELSGSMSVDRAAYRRALAILVRDFSKMPPYESSREALSATVRQLLIADLSDLDDHIVMARRMIGDAPALRQRGDLSAVAILQEHYARRKKSYSAILARIDWRG